MKMTGIIAAEDMVRRPNRYRNPTRKLRRRRENMERDPHRGSSSRTTVSYTSWRQSLSITSLLLALSCDGQSSHVSAFAPIMSTGTTLDAPSKISTSGSIDNRSGRNNGRSRRTTFSFRNVDDDTSRDSNNDNIGVGDMGMDIRTTTRKVYNSASHLESLLSRSIPSTPTITTHFNDDNGQYTKRMPSWLRPRDDQSSFEDKFSALREIMKESSYLSHLEAERVISAIQDASHGHEDQMAGAAEFCLMLVDTMEMAAGVETLIGAVFHYCECYSARLHEAKEVNFPPSLSSESPSESSFSHLNYWDCYKSYYADYHHPMPNNYLDSRAIKIGPDAHQLAQDAARIKRVEMVMVPSQEWKSSSTSVYHTNNLRLTPEEAMGMRNMLLSETRDWRALAIRSAACLYRLCGINAYYAGKNLGISTFSPQDIRVAREALWIHAPLTSRLGMHRLKNEIEGAAFSILYPRQHAKVTAMTQRDKPCRNDNGDECIVSNLADGMRLILDQVTQKVEHLLEKDRYFLNYVKKDSVKVTARIKEPYSLWRKMLKLKAKNVLDVPDALALRVVFDAKKQTDDENDDVTSANERALCYYVQKSCLSKFQPVKEDGGRFKDYIARPKPNGYQSLHYTAFTHFDGDEWPFEIQIRSSEMHQVAEYGLAAHWDYKAQDNKAQERSNSESPHYAFKLDKSSDAYLRSVQEWHWQQAQARASWVAKSSSEGNAYGDANESLTPYLEKLRMDQSNLAREHVYVFLSCDYSGSECDTVGTDPNSNSFNDSSVISCCGTCTSSQILELPAGACILDAIHESERMLGYKSGHFHDQLVQHNGSPTSITQQLSNGDIVTIPALAVATSTRERERTGTPTVSV